jgi:hypothetical protein
MHRPRARERPRDEVADGDGDHRTVSLRRVPPATRAVAMVMTGLHVTMLDRDYRREMTATSQNRSKRRAARCCGVIDDRPYWFPLCSRSSRRDPRAADPHA